MQRMERQDLFKFRNEVGADADRILREKLLSPGLNGCPGRDFYQFVLGMEKYVMSFSISIFFD